LETPRLPKAARYQAISWPPMSLNLKSSKPNKIISSFKNSTTAIIVVAIGIAAVAGIAVLFIALIIHPLTIRLRAFLLVTLKAQQMA
jgi:hypothetical protein